MTGPCPRRRRRSPDEQFTSATPHCQCRRWTGTGADSKGATTRAQSSRAAIRCQAGSNSTPAVEQESPLAPREIHGDGAAESLRPGLTVLLLTTTTLARPAPPPVGPEVLH